jgi:prepilin-type N-terminal cleavage/methylation domain-containing protein
MEVKTMKKTYMDDRGLSMVELLVSVAVLSVVITAVMGFVIFSSNQYHKGSRDASLSNESQLLVARLENLLMNASYGVGTGDVADIGKALGAATAAPESGNVLYIYNRVDDGNYQVLCIYPDAAGQTLEYQELTYKNVGGSWKWYTDDPSHTDGSWKWDTGLSEDISSYVKNFSVDLSGLATGKTVTVTLEMELRDKTYKTSNTFVVRNKITNIKDRTTFETLVNSP